MHDGLMGNAGQRLPTPATSVYQPYQISTGNSYNHRWYYDPSVQVGPVPGTGVGSTWRLETTGGLWQDWVQTGGVTIATAGVPTMDVFPGRVVIGGTVPTSAVVGATAATFHLDDAPYASTSLDVSPSVYYPSGTMTYTGVNLSPNILGAGSAGVITGLSFTPTATAVPATAMVGLDLNMQHGFETVTTITGVDVAISETFGTATNSYCYTGSITNTVATMTNGTILYGATNQATNKWSLQLGDFQSQHIGKLGLGGAAVTTTPTYGLDLMGTAQDRGVIGIAESSATPTNPSSSSQAVVYVKADKLIFGWLDGATMRYKYITLSGTSTTWTHTTTAP